MSTGTLRVAFLLAVPLFAACKSGLPSSGGKHWKIESVPQRMVQHFTGYRADRDGEFIDYQYQKKKHVNLTLRRHFANNSPESPFEPYDASQTKRRPPHSIWPDPLYYMGVESLVVGVAMVGLTGAFIPIPIDSLSATAVDAHDTIFEDEQNEFVAGFTGDDSLDPPPVSEFRVKNR